MANTFYFYDLETSGFNPREARVMQFGGQRTDTDLNPIGEPDNILIKLTEDVLPDPGAILVTGITPQQTIAEGITETEFLKYFNEKIVLPGTIFAGFNIVRFDDEFMRYMHYRNFYDPYEWQWKDDRSRWDLLDVARMTRALRPEGIKWPYDSSGAPTNRLELLAEVNGLDHISAHDALSDVYATIAVARLIKSKQPKLFDYLLKMRAKKSISELVGSGKPFIYTSGKYSSEHEKTTVAVTVGKHPKRQGYLVYDLRYDPEKFITLSASELAEAWKWQKDQDPAERLPVKDLLLNRNPAIAPLSVLDDKSKARLKINDARIRKNLKILMGAKDFASKLHDALGIMDKLQQERLLDTDRGVDTQLYDNFIGDKDKPVMTEIRKSSPDKLSDFADKLKDDRLKSMLLLYKARNFQQHLTESEAERWELFKRDKLFAGDTASRFAQFFNKLEIFAMQPDLTKREQNLIEELRLYGESIMPADI